MRRPNAVVVLGSLLSFVPCVGLAQVAGLVSRAAPVASPSYAQRPPVRVSSLPAGYSVNSLTFDATTGALVSGGAGTAAIASNIPASAPLAGDDQFNIDELRSNLPTIDGVNTLATFDGVFVAQAGPSAGRDVRFTMIGNDPRLGGTTEYPANITEVSLQLLNADGSVFQTVSYSPFEHLTLDSPNFEPLNYTSGSGVEYADAAQRAEFWEVKKSDWHTLLLPDVVDRLTIQVPFFVNVQINNGHVVQARSYFTGTAADGKTFVLMLSPLFNLFFDEVGVNEINLGNFTTNGLNMILFPNTFLFNLNVQHPSVPGGCCALGFHTYFLTGGFPELRWITEFATWISPGIFGGGFQDVTSLSHETAEAINDPFDDNVTPSWQFPGEPANAKVCQATLEVGDPIAVLINATTTIHVNEVNFTFHPQDVALFQWFEMGTSSSALNGAFSFPDPTVLPHSAIPCP